MREPAGDGDALLLAARQLARAVVGAVGQTDRGRAVRRRGAIASARDRARSASAASRCSRVPSSYGMRLKAWNTNPTRSRR